MSYGGSQSWSGDKVMRRCGCGVVAGLDLLLYLQKQPFQKMDDYCSMLETARKKFLPILYPFGMNGLSLTLGVNRIFHQKNLPYYAVWSVSGRDLLYKVCRQLDDDIPVVLGVGPQIPRLWKRDGLPFYRKLRDGGYHRVTSVCAHYVTVTEMDFPWMGIASWGRKYYIHQDELKDDVRKHSTYLFSNILIIRKRVN